MATLRLKDSYRKAESLVVRNGVEGMIEVTKVEAKTVSALVASRYYGGKNIEVVFLEEDREELISLPERETKILTTFFRCQPNELENRLIPAKVKQTVPEKLKATAKRATSKKPSKAKKPSPKKEETKPVLEEE